MHGDYNRHVEFIRHNINSSQELKNSLGFFLHELREMAISGVKEHIDDSTGKLIALDTIIETLMK